MGARGAARQGDSSCLRESLMGRLIGCGRRQAQHLRRYAEFVAARSDSPVEMSAPQHSSTPLIWDGGPSSDSWQQQVCTTMPSMPHR
jgi:hypothetical protein